MVERMNILKRDREEIMIALMDIPGIEDIKEIDIEGIEGVDVYTYLF